MIIYVLGQKGAGKTLFMTIWAALHYLNGYRIFATYHIEKMAAEIVKELEDFERFTSRSEDSLCLIDEAYLWADKRRSGSVGNLLISKFGAQSRKKHVDVMISSQGGSESEQIDGFIDARLRALSDYIMEPFIYERIGDPINGVPSLIGVEIYTTNREYIGRWILPTKIGKLNVPYIYDTHEEVSGHVPAAVIRRRKLIAKYWDTDETNAKELAEKILVEEESENVPKTELITVASYIFRCKKRGEIPIWLAQRSPEAAVFGVQKNNQSTNITTINTHQLPKSNRLLPNSGSHIYNSKYEKNTCKTKNAL